MNILYLSEDYVYSKVHHNLCHKLIKRDKINHLSIFCLLRENTTPRLDNQYDDINYNTYLPKFNGNKFRYKLDFSYKIKEKFKLLKSQVDINSFDIVFAATLFSEGALAYKIYKEFGIPFLVVVRGTDINLYLKMAPHLWGESIRILKNAKNVVFLNARVREKMRNHWVIGRMMTKIKTKCTVIPNGIDNFWIENKINKINGNHGHRLLYIGTFDKNKNVELLQKAVLSVRQHKIEDLTLTLIGGGASHHKNVVEICEKYPEVFTYKGRIYNKKILSDLMRQYDAFIMVSHSETFGLVYLEALSQGLPIIYSAGQGIDGYFKNKVGISVNPRDISDIERGIVKLFKEYETLQIDTVDLGKFNWDKIVEYYYNLLIQ